MHLQLQLHLPRDAASVPAVRRVCRQVMESLGISGEQSDDVLLALSEACGNVVRHAKTEHEYDVCLVFDNADCTLTVTDRGGASSPVETWGGDADDHVESGRGISLMGALMDTLCFHPTDDGTAVELHRTLTLPSDSMLTTLTP